MIESLNALFDLSDYQVVILCTIRTDSLDTFVGADAFKDHPKEELVWLKPMPTGSYTDVIRKPLERALEAGRRIEFDDALIEKLLVDIEASDAKDALPLLAFTLEWLLSEFGDEATITIEDYKTIGGIAGAIDEGVEWVLKKAAIDPRLPHDRDALLLSLIHI